MFLLEMHKQIYKEISKQRNHLKDLGIGGNIIILKWMLKEYDTDLIKLALGMIKW
jgi:hypothetical protein